jgi:UDP-N-acetylglucosamine--N-acetylmuramyl-(pentapeptide) pyrophosphoryl-undecaprenol N-acetylglucosamine transferase
MVLQALPSFARLAPDLQWFHLSGPNDVEKLRQAYASMGFRAVVHSFFSNMEFALGAADAAISRAGASSLAELAAMQLPAILVPYPAATDDHQLHNALAFVETGAARLLEQSGDSAEILAPLILDFIRNPYLRESMQTALSKWQAPRAAEQIAQGVMRELGLGLLNFDAPIPNSPRTLPDDAIATPSFEGGLSV